MNSSQVIALFGAVILAFIVRIFNIVVEWLSRILGVKPPAPIPASVDQSGLGAVRSTKTPDAPSAPVTEHPESPSQHP